jgi:hypothetical protein
MTNIQLGTDILSNIFQASQEAPNNKKPSFYMSPFLIDAICASISFP